MENAENISEKELRQLIMDVTLIKKILSLEKDPEGELSDWAKNALNEARKRKEYVSLEEVKGKILTKKC